MPNGPRPGLVGAERIGSMNIFFCDARARENVRGFKGFRSQAQDGLGEMSWPDGTPRRQIRADLGMVWPQIMRGPAPRLRFVELTVFDEEEVQP